ncbi:hypothetical protein PSTG_05503 [Puccinia striiformis f. sp. tritici PST-78]|uniref:Uncharacterized protein n=1 Tax=Puccinia striiformis f. sp. tritici PST-78 TaxID=1165861 RepID=A0A0L0VPD8_9BASI|nr:hypothetical protein PSTG_05503 [Puccinia striiformis f. sp. tritici PST-78]
MLLGPRNCTINIKPSTHLSTTPGKIFSPATDYTPYTGALGGINPSCAPRGLDKKGDSKSLIFNRQIISFQGHQNKSCEWKKATSHAQRKILLRSNGVRWSVLNELTYWNPIDHVDVEPMHCLSGMLEWHCQKLWGLNVIAADISDSKKLVQVGYPLAEDYFDGEEWEENLEQTQNKPTCPSINMESLQEALMDINEKIQLENND